MSGQTLCDFLALRRGPGPCAMESSVRHPVADTARRALTKGVITHDAG